MFEFLDIMARCTIFSVLAALVLSAPIYLLQLIGVF